MRQFTECLDCMFTHFFREGDSVCGSPEEYRFGFYWETTSGTCCVFRVAGSSVVSCLRQSPELDFTLSTCRYSLSSLTIASSPFDHGTFFSCSQRV